VSGVETAGREDLLCGMSGPANAPGSPAAQRGGPRRREQVRILLFRPTVLRCTIKVMEGAAHLQVIKTPLPRDPFTPAQPYSHTAAHSLPRQCLPAWWWR